MQIKCKRCNYEWDYSGKSEWYTSCPRCRTNVKVGSGPEPNKNQSEKETEIYLE